MEEDGIWIVEFPSGRAREFPNGYEAFYRANQFAHDGWRTREVPGGTIYSATISVGENDRSISVIPKKVWDGWKKGEAK